MKTATVIVKLTKDHHVHRAGVTPIEALILAAEHNIKSGSDPLEVVKGTEKEVTRTEDEEILRLRGRYVKSKVDVLKDFRQLPTTFEDAIEKGKGVTMPSGSLASQPTAAVIASATLTK